MLVKLRTNLLAAISRQLKGCRKLSSDDSGLVNVTYKGRYALLTMNNGENRFSYPFLDALNKNVDEVLQSDAQALVTTGTGKFYSNGLDLPWVLQNRDDPKKILDFMNTFRKLMARFLVFPLPTVAAINGHAYAGGAVMAFAHDYRIMNSEKGWMCLPEVNLQVRYGPGLCEIVKEKIPETSTLTEIMLFGNRYTAIEALAKKLVDHTCQRSELIEESIKIIFDNNGIGKDGIDKKTLFSLKMDLYREAVSLLCDDIDKLYLLELMDYLNTF